MKTSHSRVDAFSRWIIRWRWPVFLGSIVFAMALGYGAQAIRLKNDYRVFFSKENPRLEAYERLQRVYTKDDNIMVVVTRPGLDVFSAEYLAAVQWLTAEAWKLPYVTRVDSVSNFQHSEAEGDDLLVGDLVADPASASEADLARFRSIAHAEPLLENRLVGHDPQVTAVNLTLTLPGRGSSEPLEAAEAARELRDRFEAEFPGFEGRLTGLVMLNDAFARASMRDMATLVPLMYGGMFLVMGWLLRSGWGTVGAVLVVMLSSVAAMGMMGWLGIPLTPPVATAPTIIMTLAVADSIHILVAFLHHLRRGQSREQALKESLRINFQPVLLTSVTTVVGFLSLNFSDAPPFRDLGNVVAMGVAAAWVFSVLTLPAFMAMAPFRAQPAAEERRARWLERFAEWIIRRRAVGLWGSVAAVAVLAVFVPRIELNDQWVKYFSPGIEFRTDTDYAMEHLTGIYSIDYSLSAGESSGISEPGYLGRMDSFADWLRRQPEVRQVNSLADVMKKLNRNMHEDRPEEYRLPGSRELAAQYLLLYEMSLPFGLDLNNRINVDKSASRLTATTANITTREVRGLLGRAERWQAEHWREDWRAAATSPTVMFSYISQSNIESMLGGTALALLVISVILGVTLRSVRYGLLSLVPNLVPAVLGFGVWGLLVGSMGMSLSVVTGMTLGIVVDDTVHFLSNYLRARREQGLEPADAVRYAFRTVGKAMVATTVILVVGFGILSFSAFRLNNWMAQLTAIVIAFALITDFVLLPAVLLTFDRKRRAAAAQTDRTKGGRPEREAVPAAAA